MPVEGTKKIELDGRQVFLPSDQVELEPIVAAGLQLQREIAEAKEKLDVLKESALAIASRHRFSKKTVTLAAPRAGAVKVTWSTDTIVDEDGARLLETELAPNVFSSIFNKQIAYSPRRGLSSFMKAPQAPELEKLKLRIATILEFKEKTPSVKFIDPGEPTGAAAEDDE
jgi:hypothetical protein